CGGVFTGERRDAGPGLRCICDLNVRRTSHESGGLSSVCSHAVLARSGVAATTQRVVIGQGGALGRAADEVRNRPCREARGSGARTAPAPWSALRESGSPPIF